MKRKMMKTITVKLPEELSVLVEADRAKLGVSTSEMIRTIISRTYFPEKK